MDSNGQQFQFADISSGLIEVDTLSTDETPNISYSFTEDSNSSLEASLEISARDLDLLCTPTLERSKVFDIEYDVSILTQTRWHRKKRINKKWIKRYGMKSDAVKMRATARVMSYNTETGECEFDVDKLEYLWRPDQMRKNLKIEI